MCRDGRCGWTALTHTSAAALAAPKWQRCRSGVAVESGSTPMSFAKARELGPFYFAAWAANCGRYQLLRCFALNRFLTHDYTITPALHVSMPECSRDGHPRHGAASETWSDEIYLPYDINSGFNPRLIFSGLCQPHFRFVPDQASRVAIEWPARRCE